MRRPTDNELKIIYGAQYGKSIRYGLANLFLEDVGPESSEKSLWGFRVRICEPIIAQSTSRKRMLSVLLNLVAK